MYEKNLGKTACSLRRSMKIRRVNCSSGPTSQLTYIIIIPVMAYKPRSPKAYFSHGGTARLLSRPPGFAQFCREPATCNAFRDTRAWGRYHQPLVRFVLLRCVD